MEYLSLKKITENCYKVDFENTTIGEFIRDVDGYFYFALLKDNQGLWSDYILLEIGNKLKDLNKDWNEHLTILMNESK